MKKNGTKEMSRGERKKGIEEKRREVMRRESRYSEVHGIPHYHIY